MSLNNDNVIIRFKRGTEAGWMAEDKGNNPVLAVGEPGYHKEFKQLKIGDGVTAWNELPWQSNNYITIELNGYNQNNRLSENLALFQKCLSMDSIPNMILNITFVDVPTPYYYCILESSSIGVYKSDTQIIIHGIQCRSYDASSLVSSAFGYVGSATLEIDMGSESNLSIYDLKLHHPSINTIFSRQKWDALWGQLSLIDSKPFIAHLCLYADPSILYQIPWYKGTAEIQGVNYWVFNPPLDTQWLCVGINPKNEEQLTLILDSSPFGVQYTPAIHTSGEDVLPGSICLNGLMPDSNKNNGLGSITLGSENVIADNTMFSTLIGANLTTSTSLLTVIGVSNEDIENGIFIVGNGDPEDVTKRSNALILDTHGNLTVSGTVSNSGEDYAEYFEWADSNILNEDRVGYIVTLQEDKICKAQPGDDILGIISGTACVIGDEAAYEWKQKYATDDFGRIIIDMKEQFIEVPLNTDKTATIRKSIGLQPVRRLNPNYDASQDYIPRSERSEWDCVGLIGKLHARDDGTCVVGGYAAAGVDGIATYSAEKTNMRVLKRLSDNIILVFMK